MLEYLQYFDTLNPYVAALLIVASFFVFSKIAVLIIERIIVQFTKRTKTKVDDKLIERTKTPISILLIVIGIRLGLAYLVMTPTVERIVTGIAEGALIMVCTWIAIRIADVLILNWGKKWADKTENSLDDQLVRLFHRASGIILFIMGILLILTNSGIEIGPLLASLGIGGLAIAFAMQQTLGNFFGGISLVLDKNIKHGDLISLDDGTMGTIEDIGFRSTKVKNFDQEIIIVPNGILANAKFKNVALPATDVRVVVPFSVAYGTDIKEVRDMVLKEINKIKGIAKEPEPFVMFLEMADSSLNFKAFYYVDHYDKRYDALEEGNERIYNLLNKHNINIPFPQMDVHLKND
ncbi:MAG: mechanosensitive ion channel family protein [Candidatus Woesearchaeota archaeon]